MIDGDFMILFRPVGKIEYKLIKCNGFKYFPERLPEQPIFYPVLNVEYAREIACKWNVNDESSGYKGYVLEFEIDDNYIKQFEIHTVGKKYHQELWIPSECLDEFNSHIIGNIKVIEEY